MKQSSWLLRGAFAAMVVAGTLGVSTQAQATEARSQSLLYNMAFPDQTDIYLFPQNLPNYQGLYFHLPDGIDNLYGGLVLDMESGAAWGLFVHRPTISNFDQFRINTTNAASIVTGLLTGSPDGYASPDISGQMFDLMYGNGTWGVNARVHFWSQNGTQQGILLDPADPDRAITSEINFGYNINPETETHAAVLVRWVDNAGTAFRLQAGGRYFEGGNARFRSVYAGELQLGVFIPDGGGDAALGISAPIKGGVHFAAVPNELSIGLLIGADLQMFDIPGSDFAFGVALPTVEIGSEWTPMDWFAVRAGVRGGYGWQFAGAADEPVNFQQLVFSSGVGFWVAPFRLDAVLQYQLWQQGPWLVGGTPGLFAGATLSYEWGQPAGTTIEQTQAPKSPAEQLTGFTL